MRSLTHEVGALKRRFNVVFPLKRIGFHFPHPPQETKTFPGKLEFCLRLRSESEYAEDVIDGVTYRTTFPHIIVKRPSTVHSYAIDSNRESVYLQYAPELEEAMTEAGLLGEEYCWPVQITAEISSMILKMHALSDNLLQPHRIDSLDLQAMCFFEALVTQKNAHDSLPAHMEKKIQEVAWYFRVHLTDDIDLNELLAGMGLSRRTFFRYWKILFDVSPAQYLKELKLQHASELLIATSMPVWEITEKLSFKDSHYLCRIFRERFGETPLQYRKLFRFGKKD